MIKTETETETETAIAPATSSVATDKPTIYVGLASVLGPMIPDTTELIYRGSTIDTTIVSLHVGLATLVMLNGLHAKKLPPAHEGHRVRSRDRLHRFTCKCTGRGHRRQCNPRHFAPWVGCNLEKRADAAPGTYPKTVPASDEPPDGGA